jgi:hypothetical protein
MIYRTISLLSGFSALFLSSLTIGATNTGDSKHTAISFKNLLEAKKLRLGRSNAKLMNLSFSSFSISAIVLYM